MIIKILIFFLIFIIISLILIFLGQIFSPAVKKQTSLNDDMLFHKIEHDFEKLKTSEDFREIDQRAAVMCSCKKTFAEPSIFSVDPDQSCAAIFTSFKSLNDCKYSCIGLGDCVKKCNQEAIVIENGTARITNLCSGCGNCISSCPKDLIKLVPVTEKEIVKCCNEDLNLTSCSAFQKTESVEYPEKKGFKIWASWYKLLHKTRK